MSQQVVLVALSATKTLCGLLMVGFSGCSEIHVVGVFLESMFPLVGGWFMFLKKVCPSVGGWLVVVRKTSQCYLGLKVACLQQLFGVAVL